MMRTPAPLIPVPWLMVNAFTLTLLEHSLRNAPLIFAIPQLVKASLSRYNVPQAHIAVSKTLRAYVVPIALAFRIVHGSIPINLHAPLALAPLYHKTRTSALSQLSFVLVVFVIRQPVNVKEEARHVVFLTPPFALLVKRLIRPIASVMATQQPVLAPLARRRFSTIRVKSANKLPLSARATTMCAPMIRRHVTQSWVVLCPDTLQFYALLHNASTRAVNLELDPVRVVS